jgi:Tol biopolymer transport system component
VDARSDIFSLGALLHELFTGRKAFEGKSQASLIAAIMNTQTAPISKIQPSLPPTLDPLVRGCLNRDPSERWQTAHDVLKQLQWIQGSSSAIPVPAARTGRSLSAIWIAVVLLVLIGGAAAALRFLLNNRPTSEQATFSVVMPTKISLAVGENSPGSAAMSPDGSRLILRGVDADTGKILLYVRPVGSLNFTPIPGTEDGASPFWAPDGQRIAYFAHGKLMRIDLNGGAPRVICDASTTNGAGTWNADDVIVANLNDAGLSRVSADGGTAEPATVFDPAAERYHNWPQFLPDGKHFLYSIAGRLASTNGIAVGLLNSKETKPVANGVLSPSAYLPSGYLLFLKGGALMAQSFDARALKVNGNPMVLAEHATSPFAASESGTVMYRNLVIVPNQFLWIGWDGHEIGPAMQPGFYTDPALSPDGSKLAFAKKENSGASLDIWISDMAAGTPPRRLTFDPGDDRGPVWSPDGSAIAFWSNRQSAPGLYRKNANGVGDEELLIAEKNDIWPYQWTCDGKCLIYFGGPAVPAYDISIYSFTERKSMPLIQSKFVDADGAISPDGRWIAFEDNSSGRYEVYLTTFPASSTKLAVTSESGVDSLWSSDGKKLFYVNSVTQELLSVDVKPGNPPQFGAPQRIYRGPLDWLSDHSFDIDAKRQRVLVQTSTASQTDITVLLNWRPQLPATKP